MLTITITVQDGGKHAAAQIPSEFGPALRSALEEIRNEVGERVSGVHQYGKEAALTRAVAALGALAGAVNEVVADEDRNYA